MVREYLLLIVFTLFCSLALAQNLSIELEFKIDEKSQAYNTDDIRICIASIDSSKRILLYPSISKDGLIRLSENDIPDNSFLVLMVKKSFYYFSIYSIDLTKKQKWIFNISKKPLDREYRLEGRLTVEYLDSAGIDFYTRIKNPKAYKKQILDLLSPYSSYGPPPNDEANDIRH